MGKPSKAILLCTLLAVAAALAVMLQSQLKHLRVSHQKSRIAAEVEHVGHELDRISFHAARSILDSLSRSQVVKDAARGKTPPGNVSVTNEAEMGRNVIDAAIVYVMNKDGTVVASSSYLSQGKMTSLLNKNYRFRPYFQEAMTGDKVIYPALGVTTGQRGIYWSAPINQDGAVIGAIVVKLGLERIDKILKSCSHPVALATPDGVVFASNRADWLYRAIRPLTTKELDRIHRSKQFADKTVRPLELQQEGLLVISSQGEKYVSAKSQIRETNWTLTGLAKFDPEHPLSAEQFSMLVQWSCVVAILIAVILALLFNMAKRRQAEEDLAFSEHRFRALFDQAFQFIGLLDLDGNTIVANRTAAETCGVRPEDAIGKLFWETPFWEHDEDQRKQIKDAVLRAAKGETSRFEVTHYDVEKNLRHFDFSMKPVTSPDGEVAMLIAEARDITERRAAEEELAKHRDHLAELVDEQTTELRESEQKSLAVITAMQAGYLILTETGDILGTNEEFRRMIGADGVDDVVGRSFVEMIVGQTNEALKLCLESGSIDRVELELEQKSGRIPVELSAKTMSLHGEKRVVCVCRDISERRKAERELAEANQKLVESALFAGKAEVATSVLHNVGNVLNSVVISCGVLRTKILRSKSSHLARLAHNLNKHTDDLANYLTNDDTGKKLPSFVNQLSDSIKNEQEDMLVDLGQLVDHIDHISEIIRVQQSFSKGVGFSEVVKIRVIVQEAIEIAQSSSPRGDIEITTDLADIPAMNLARHRIVEILVNLIRNAIDALRASDQADKRICVQTKVDGDMICVSVADNGIGIAPDALTKIFNHGFTTKEHGHGFGLHSCANSASEMGGHLDVDSPGLGMGACFTLTIPRSDRG